MNDKSDTQAKEKKVVRKKLSLGGTTPDIKKILASKVASKGKVEIIGEVKPIMPKEPVQSSEKELVKESVISETTNKLTNEEQARRSKAIEVALRRSQAEEKLKLSQQSASEEVAKYKVEEKIVAKEEALVLNPTTEHTSKNHYTKDKHYENTAIDSQDEVVTVKKKKSYLLTQEEKRKHNAVKNWKNASVNEVTRARIKSEEDETPESVTNVSLYSKYTPPVKRKNKYNFTRKVKIYKDIILSSEVSVKVLARMLAEKVRVIIKELDKLGSISQEDDIIDKSTAEIVAINLGHSVQLVETLPLDYKYLHFDDDEAFLIEKPPVVTIMGHVDHGKTTLLDTIRKSHVVKSESGGITQHIGAYQVKTVKGKLITFIDTPGHQAFTAIRARGSKVTDIVVIVIAADDSIKPQTIEAFNHAKEAQVPIIIAINKIDKPEADIKKVKVELLQYNIVVEEMGGDVLSAEISAIKQTGIDNLLDTILLQAEMLDLKTREDVLGKASVVEVKLEKGLGYFATVLIERGKIKIGDHFVTGLQYGKIKSMRDDVGKYIKEAKPCMPVGISGFSSTVEAGDDFFVVESESIATKITHYRNSLVVSNQTKPISIIDILQSKNDVTIFAVILKADTQGTLEAIKGELDKIEQPELEIKIIHSAVGEITESDIMLAQSSKAVIFGFNSRANKKAKELSEQEKVNVRYHSIIYKLIDDVRLMLSGLLDPDIVENIIGYAEVREVFNITKVGNIAGCFVTEGMLKRAAKVRLLRNNVVIHDGVLSTLKRFKEDVKEVKNTLECGVAFERYNDIQAKDLVECYETHEVKKIIK